MGGMVAFVELSAMWVAVLSTIMKVRITLCDI